MRHHPAKALLAITPFLFCSFACGGHDSDSEPKNVFGKDDREIVTSRALPWSALGRLDIGCSGTLIGEDLALTAAHCLVDDESGKARSNITTFRPNQSRESIADSAWIDEFWVGSIHPEKDRIRDWAIIRLSKPLGNRYGWLDVEKVDFTKGNFPFTTNLAGFSGDFAGGETAAVHQNCTIRGAKDGRLFHDCDSTAGISGGPFLNMVGGKPRIVAISVSEFVDDSGKSALRSDYTEDYANVGIGVSEAADVIAAIRNAIADGTPTSNIAGATEFQNRKGSNPQPSEERKSRFDPERIGANSSYIIAAAKQLARSANEITTIADRYQTRELSMLSARVYHSASAIAELTEAASQGRISGPTLGGRMETVLLSLGAEARQLEESARRFLSLYRDSQLASSVFNVGSELGNLEAQLTDQPHRHAAHNLQRFFRETTKTEEDQR